MKTFYHWLNFKIKEIAYRFINLAVYMSFHRCVRRIQLGWLYVLLFQYVFNICYYGHTTLQIFAWLLSCHVNTSRHMVLAVQLHRHSFLHVGSFVWRHQLQLCAHTIDLEICILLSVSTNIHIVPATIWLQGWRNNRYTSRSVNVNLTIATTLRGRAIRSIANDCKLDFQ